MDRAQHALRRLRAIAGMSQYRAAFGSFALGTRLPGLPALTRGSTHEIFAAGRQDAPAAAGFVTGLALIAGSGNRPSLWVRHAGKRDGTLYGGGLAALGFDPGALIYLPLEEEKDALRAAREGLRCDGLACVVIEIAGPARHLDLSATRRLKLAAAEHGVTALILRADAKPGPSAAETRWRVTASLSASPGLGLPGRPAFTLTLLKHRSAGTGRNWDLEWDHETRQFNPKTLSRPLAALPLDRTHQADREGVRARAG
jgi:protein ImuA